MIALCAKEEQKTEKKKKSSFSEAYEKGNACAATRPHVEKNVVAMYVNIYAVIHNYFRCFWEEWSISDVYVQQKKKKCEL